jgi:predicted dinucleotide-binding enzyme
MNDLRMGALPRIAVLGAGKAGSAIARVAVGAGYDVSIAASGDPTAIELITKVLVPGAEPRWTEDAVRDADVVVISVPLHRFHELDPTLFHTKIVIDAMNYWPAVDGVLDAFETPHLTSSEIVQRRLATASVVKTLNHVGYHELEEERRPAGAVDRHALGIAGDDARAVDLVTRIIERMGFDAVPLDSLPAGAILAPGGPVFGVPHTRDQLIDVLREERAS